MNIILPDQALEKLSKKKISNLVIDVFENGRQTFAYSNSPSEWQNFSTRRYVTNGYKSVLVITSEKNVHQHIDADTILLLDDKGLKAAYWQENSIIIEQPLSHTNKVALSSIIPPEAKEITDPDTVDQIAALCGLPYTTNPARKYLLSSKLQVLNWDFLSLDRSTKQFFKYRNDYVNVNTNLTIIFEKNNVRAAMTMGTKEKNSYILKLLNDDLETLLSIRNIVFNEIE
jgi:hypothetical protein